MVPRFSSPLTASEPREMAHTVINSKTTGSSYSEAIRPAVVAICAYETGIRFSIGAGNRLSMYSRSGVEKKLLIHTRSQCTPNMKTTQANSSQRASKNVFFQSAGLVIARAVSQASPLP